MVVLFVVGMAAVLVGNAVVPAEGAVEVEPSAKVVVVVVVIVIGEGVGFYGVVWFAVVPF